MRRPVAPKDLYDGSALELSSTEFDRPEKEEIRI
jgi:hypothetical protein